MTDSISTKQVLYENYFLWLYLNSKDSKTFQRFVWQRWNLPGSAQFARAHLSMPKRVQWASMWEKRHCVLRRSLWSRSMLRYKIWPRMQVSFWPFWPILPRTDFHFSTLFWWRGLLSCAWTQAYFESVKIKKSFDCVVLNNLFFSVSR